jgi:uridine kinase
MSFIIGISGGSGSGKTSFVKALATSFDPSEITLISQDDYYRPREKQKIDKNGIRNFDLPKSIHQKQFATDIKKLINGETVTRQEYTFNNEKATSKELVFKPAPIIIVEGLFIFHLKKIASLLDLKVLIQAKTSDKIIRRILRDQTERNYPLDDVLYRYKHHVMPAYEKYISPYINDVDIIINNNLSFAKGLEVLQCFMEKKLPIQ